MPQHSQAKSDTYRFCLLILMCKNAKEKINNLLGFNIKKKKSILGLYF